MGNFQTVQPSTAFDIGDDCCRRSWNCFIITFPSNEINGIGVTFPQKLRKLTVGGTWPTMSRDPTELGKEYIED